MSNSTENAGRPWKVPASWLFICVQKQAAQRSRAVLERADHELIFQCSLDRQCRAGQRSVVYLHFLRIFSVYAGLQRQVARLKQGWAQNGGSIHRAAWQSTVGNDRKAHTRAHNGHHIKTTQKQKHLHGIGQMSMPIAHHTRHIRR